MLSKALKGGQMYESGATIAEQNDGGGGNRLNYSIGSNSRYLQEIATLAQRVQGRGWRGVATRSLSLA